VFAGKALLATNRDDPGTLRILAAAYAEAGQFNNAVRVQQEAMALLQNDQDRKACALRLQLYQSSSPYRDDGLLAEMASALLARGKYAEAEPFARACLAWREKEFPDDWRTFSACALLGGSLLGQKKYREAEPLLLSGYEGMKQREEMVPVESKFRLAETMRRLVLLYEASAPANEASKWRKREAVARAETQTEAEGETRASGVTYAQLGRFAQASAAFARVLAINPDDHEVWHWQAAALLQRGELHAFRELRHESVKRFANTTDPNTAERIAKDFLILPASEADLETATRMADRAVNVPTNHPDMAWFQFAKGLAEYRLGNFASAVGWTEKVLSDAGHEANRDAEACMVLAMAKNQLSQTNEARTTFDRGLKIVDAKMPKLSSGDLGAGWTDWVFALALRNEANALIDGNAATARK
jgi:Flp pilus assembly protein TadD